MGLWRVGLTRSKIYGRGDIHATDEEEMIRLNLGCGSAYRPGYINIDMGGRSVPDVFADVGDLPFEPNSVGDIEAVQLLEHFDMVHSKYVLSEWFRILRPTGSLSIETPDLEISLKKLSSSKKGETSAAVQWLYGIDSPGLQHKGGFTYKLLEEVLSEIGYVDIRLRPARTHVYAPGMRVECRKPENSGMSQFFAVLRKRVKKSLETDDSFVLIPLEGELAKLKSEVGGAQHVDRDKARGIASLASVWNPSISISFLGACAETHLIEESELVSDIAAFRQLADTRFHEKAFTLWMRSRKEKDSATEFSLFVERIGKTVREALEHPESQDQLLGYIASLDPTPIELLDLCLMKQRAKRLLNTGILRFSRGDYRGAEENFSESLRMDPEGPLTHWNLARVGIAIGHSDEVILRHYSESLSLFSDSRVRAHIEKERHFVSSGERRRIDARPVSEYDVLAQSVP